MIPKLRTNEQQGEEEDEREEREKEEDEGEEDGSSEEEFNQHLSLFPELLLDSQVFATRLLLSYFAYFVLQFFKVLDGTQSTTFQVFTVLIDSAGE